MIGVGIAFVVLGVICLFVVPWVGVAAGIIGLVLALLWLVGIGRGITRGGARREKSAPPHL
jgi:hypothetical protein